MELWIFIFVTGILVFCLIILLVILFLQNKRKNNNKNNVDYFDKIIHDLKTPIYAIEGFALLTTKSLDQPKKAEEYLGKIQNVSRHMLSLVKDILDISKINDGKLEIHNAIGDLNDILNCCLDTIEPQMIQRKIHFQKNFHFIHNKVIVDDLHLNQILTNILSNAIKYTEKEGSIIFTIFEKQKTEESSTYIFKIQDTGYGMSEEFQQHIFEPFAQEHTLAHTDVESSGLGLFIVKRLLELMGGAIEVDSKLNEGSCFTIQLDLDFIEKKNSEK
ncbi:MAG: HAMP domain-containing histidine kinase [Anaeroplasmataceae bacterium]|nr:HAMP domain-containing histidine kinase [Anaeroplasmataceae bacterium]